MLFPGHGVVVIALRVVSSKERTEELYLWCVLVDLNSCSHVLGLHAIFLSCTLFWLFEGTKALVEKPMHLVGDFTPNDDFVMGIQRANINLPLQLEGNVFSVCAIDQRLDLTKHVENLRIWCD